MYTIIPSSLALCWIACCFWVVPEMRPWGWCLSYCCVLMCCVDAAEKKLKKKFCKEVGESSSHKTSCQDHILTVKLPWQPLRKWLCDVRRLRFPLRLDGCLRFSHGRRRRRLAGRRHGRLSCQRCPGYWLLSRHWAHFHSTHTYPFNGPFSGTTQVSWYQKGKPTWILVKQETVSGSGISWAICKSAPRSRQTTTPAPHHSVLYRPDALPAAQPTASKHWRQHFHSTHI